MIIKEYGHIKPREIKCSGCGAILEYTNADLSYRETPYQRMTKWAKENSYDLEMWIECPVCGCHITRDNDNQSIHIQKI